MRLLVLSILLIGCGKSSTSLPPDSGSNDVGVAGSLDDCFAGISPRVSARTVNLLDFDAEDGSTHLRLAREAGTRAFVGETTPYDLVRFGIDRSGTTECITDSGLLAYDFGHHNWNDTATATSSRTYTVKMVYDFSGATAKWTDTLSIDGAAGIPLVFGSCRSIPTPDANHCLSRGAGG
jgi:hypothetical protein